MVLYYDEKNQLMNLYQSDSQMQWINIRPVEQTSLEKLVDSHCKI